MIGFRILQRQRSVSAETVARFGDLPVANVSDVMNRMTAGGARLRPLHGGGAMAGAALTVKTRPGDNLMIHKALDLAQAGDVVVVDGGGDLSNSLIGELMISHAKVRGLAGLVLWGAVRDLAWIRAQEFPIFAAGVSHRGPYKDGPGEINVPISIDGMVIHPGDLILGDADGLLCVPFDDVEAVLAATHKKMEAEKKTLADIAAGKLDTTWIDATLRRIGCNTEPL